MASRARQATAARARRSVLFTASALVSRSDATSAARHRSTSRRMSTARCRGARCCSAAMKASRTDSRHRMLRWIIARRQDQAVRGGLHHVASGRASPRRSSPVATGATSIGTRSALQQIEANVGRDPVQPWSQSGPILERRQRPPSAEHRVLDGVLGLVDRSKHPVAVAGQLPAVLLQRIGRDRGARGVPAHQGSVRTSGIIRRGPARPPSAHTPRARTPPSSPSRPSPCRRPRA